MIARLQLIATVAIAASAIPIGGLVAQPVDWRTPPDVQQPARYIPPTVEEHRLSNGLPVYLVRRADVPLVQVNILMRTGAIDEPAGKAGLAQITASLLRRDAGNRTGEEVSREVQFLGAELTTQATAHSIEVHLRTPLSSLDPALELLAAAVLRPAFDEAYFESLRSRWADVLERRASDGVEVANWLFRRALFGDHAYGRFPSGTAAGMRALNVADVRAFHRLAADPRRSALVIVGAVEVPDILSRLEDMFGKGWPAADQRVTANPPPAAAVPGLYVVNSPGARQSNIRIAQRAPERSSPDHHAFAVLNFVLGGSTTSRLGTRLRHTLAITYGARSDFMSAPEAGFLVSWSNVETKSTALAVRAMLEELRGIRERISPDELALARSNLIMSFPEPFMTIGGVASAVGELVVGGVAVDALYEYSDAIAGVTADQVARVARERIDARKLAVVIVGDMDSIRADLSALGLGPVIELTAEEALRISPLANAR